MSRNPSNDRSPLGDSTGPNPEDGGPSLELSTKQLRSAFVFLIVFSFVSIVLLSALAVMRALDLLEFALYIFGTAFLLTGFLLGLWQANTVVGFLLPRLAKIGLLLSKLADKDSNTPNS